MLTTLSAAAVGDSPIIADMKRDADAGDIGRFEELISEMKVRGVSKSDPYYVKYYNMWLNTFNNPASTELQKAEAARAMMYCMSEGIGVKYDKELMKRYFNEARMRLDKLVKPGSPDRPEALYELYSLLRYYNSSDYGCSPDDYPDFRNMLRQSAEAGCLKAMTSYGINLIWNEERVTEGLAWMERAAKAGYIPAQTWLCRNLATGTVESGMGETIKRDSEKSVYWGEKCWRHDTMCADEMAANYFYGRGTAPNYSKALECLTGRYATDDLDYSTEHTYMLACIYAKLGETDEALNIFNRLFGPDGADAYDNWETTGYYIGKGYYDGIAVPRDYAKAVKYLTKASEYGEDMYKAKALLSKCYRFGRGVTKNVAKANRLVREAREGSADAIDIDEIIGK